MFKINFLRHNDGASSLSIDIGVTNRVNKEPWTKSFKAEKLILHENFQIINYDNDVALIKLSVNIFLKCIFTHKSF